MAIDFSQKLASHLAMRAEWRSYLAERFPDDTFRNARSSRELQALAAYVGALSDEAPVLRRLATFRHANLSDMYVPGTLAQYAIDRYGFHQLEQPDSFLGRLVGLAAEDEEDVPDGVPPTGVDLDA